MTFKAKLAQIGLVFCLVVSLGSFVVAGVISQNGVGMWENPARGWVQVDSESDGMQVVSGGCQLEGGDSGLGLIS